MRNTELLTEAFRRIVVHRIPVCDDLVLQMDEGSVRVTSVLQELECDDLVPFGLLAELGLPPGTRFSTAVQVYRSAIAPRPTLGKPPTRLPDPTVYATPAAKKPPKAGRRFAADTIRMIRQQSGDGATNVDLGHRYGVDPSFISEIVRRVAYADVG